MRVEIAQDLHAYPRVVSFLSCIVLELNVSIATISDVLQLFFSAMFSFSCPAIEWSPKSI